VSDVESGQAPLTRDTTTVAELLDRYIEDQVAVLHPGTVRGYRDKARRLKASFGPVKLTKLNAQQLDRTYRSWLAEGLSPATVRHCHALPTKVDPCRPHVDRNLDGELDECRRVPPSAVAFFMKSGPSPHLRLPNLSSYCDRRCLVGR
jgi:hypothetical protein